MKNRAVLLWCFLTITVSLAGGYAFRRATHGNAADVKMSPATLNAKERKSSRLRKNEDDPSYSQKTRTSVEHSEGSERWLHWISAIENAPLDDFPQLARVARGNGIFQQLLAQRWFDSDPEHFFRALEKESNSFSDETDGSFPYEYFSDFLFEKWAGTDAEAAIGALSDTTRLLGKFQLRNTVFMEVMALDPLRGLSLMSQWRGVKGPWKNDMVKWAQKDPRKAAVAILENAAGGVTESCMKAVAEVWASSDPAGALAFAADAEGTEGQILREKVFQQWVNEDMTAASDWLAEQDDPAWDDCYRPMIIEAWGKEEPQEALAWCEEESNRNGIS